jgi:cell division protein FtsZ
MARDEGAFVAVVATSPFRFEGRRRVQQAKEALDEIGRHADVLVHFENDRMAELMEPAAEVGETFAACDVLLFHAVIGLARILTESGPLPVAVGDLVSALRGGRGTSLFGCGEAEGVDRAREAAAQALRSPLLDRELLLHDAEKIVVHVSGPLGTTFEEVALIMNELSKAAAPGAHLCLGVGTSRDPSGPLVVTILGRAGGDSKPVATPTAARVETAPFVDSTPEVALAPELFATGPSPAKAPKVKQDVLQLEPVARGRFEKIEPTIVEGEDLDVPTFLRLKLKKKQPL